MEYDLKEDSMTTCSNDSITSVVRKFLSHLRESQVYKIPKVPNTKILYACFNYYIEILYFYSK